MSYHELVGVFHELSDVINFVNNRTFLTIGTVSKISDFVFSGKISLAETRTAKHSTISVHLSLISKILHSSFQISNSKIASVLD